MSDHNLLIDTPENVTLEVEIAGFGSRCLAAIIDYSIMLVVMIALSILFAQTMRDGGLTGLWVVALYLLLQFIIITFYHLFFEISWNGQTPGKRRMGIRVVQANGLPLTPTAAVIRNLVRLFDFLPLMYGVGLISLFVTVKTQRLGDLAAQTIVIREAGQLTLNTIQEDFSVRYAHISRHTPLPDFINITELDQSDRREIVNYLRRRDELANNREHLAGLLAQRMATRMDIDQSNRRYYGERAEVLLEYIARAFEIAEHQARDDTPTQTDAP